MHEERKKEEKKEREGKVKYIPYNWLFIYAAQKIMRFGQKRQF